MRLDVTRLDLGSRTSLTVLYFTVFRILALTSTLISLLPIVQVRFRLLAFLVGGVMNI